MQVELEILRPPEPSAPTRSSSTEDTAEIVTRPLPLRAPRPSTATPSAAQLPVEPAQRASATAAEPLSASAEPALSAPLRENAPSRPAASDSAAPESAASPPTTRSNTGALGVPAERGLDLSAAGAARSLLASEAGTWRAPTSQRAELEAAERAARAEEARLAQDITGLTRQGEQRGIAPVVQDTVAFVLRPWKLISEPLRSARYHYRGLGFDAIIQADGGVRFRSKSGVHLAFIPVIDVTGKSIGTFGLALGRDVFAQRIASDAHAAERRSFLTSTSALRTHLYQQAQRAALARADQALTLTFASIEVQLERGNDRNARATLFELWDDCSEDELGATVRARVERFVRQHCLPNTPLGYGTDELVALNARRSSKARFEPYAAVLDRERAEAAPAEQGAPRPDAGNERAR